jgi:hypothetical protein
MLLFCREHEGASWHAFCNFRDTKGRLCRFLGLAQVYRCAEFCGDSELFRAGKRLEKNDYHRRQVSKGHRDGSDTRGEELLLIPLIGS